MIAGIGTEATQLAVGDKVVIPAAITNAPGTEKNGGFASQVAVLEDLVVHLPDGVPWGRVILVGLGVASAELNTQRLTLEQIHLIGSQAGTQADCAEVLDLVAAGKL